jgi:O-acetylhomoserine (thiol)-lyase
MWAAITDNTRVVFVETIANPRTQVADLKRIGELCRRAASCTWWTTP